MDRLNLDQQKAVAMHDQCASLYPGYEKPLPGTPLKIYDDIVWLDLFPMRVVHGHDHPDYFNAYAPDFVGEDSYANCEGHYITDRAPLDSNETPMPIYPQQQQQRQEPRRKHDAKEALRHFLNQLPPEGKKKARQLVRQKRPELLGDKDE